MSGYFAEAAAHHRKEADAALKLGNIVWETRARAKLSSALRGQGSAARAQGEKGSEEYKAAAASEAEKALQLSLKHGTSETRK